MTAINNNLLFKETGYVRSDSKLKRVANIQAISITTNEAVERIIPSSGGSGIDFYTTAPSEVEIQIRGLSSEIYRDLNKIFDYNRNGGNTKVDWHVAPNAKDGDKSGIILKNFSIASLPTLGNYTGDSSSLDFSFTLVGSSFDIIQFDEKGELL